MNRRDTSQGVWHFVRGSALAPSDKSAGKESQASTMNTERFGAKSPSRVVAVGSRLL